MSTDNRDKIAQVRSFDSSRLKGLPSMGGDTRRLHLEPDLAPTILKNNEVVDGVRQQAEKQLYNVLLEIFASALELPIADIEEFETVAEVANVFDNDWRKLKSLRQDWGKLVFALVRIETSDLISKDIETDVAAAVNDWKLKILKTINWPTDLYKHGHLELDQLGVSQAFKLLSSKLSNAVELMAASMVEHLKILQDEAVCGVIEWTGRNECRFSFCTREIKAQITENFHTGKLVSRESKIVSDISDSNWAQDILSINEVWELTDEATMSSELTVHIHDISHAIVARPESLSVPIPNKQQKVLDAIPVWLNDHVTIVEGKLIRERKLCKVVETESWELTRLVTHTQQTIAPSFYGYDPGIVLAGFFVLDGWMVVEPVATQSHTLVSWAKNLGNLLS